MKKTLLTSVGVLGALIGVANAEVTKEQCEKIRRMVWVEKDNTCILRNICGSNSSQSNSYCSKTFVQTQTMTPEQAYKLVNMYLIKKGDGNKCQKVELRDLNPNNTGQDFVQCTTADGYYEFEFDDVSESFVSTARESIAKVICGGMYSGEFVEGGDRRGGYYKFDYGCSNISEEDCKTFADDMNAINGGVRVWETVHKETKLGEYDVGDSKRGCGIRMLKSGH